MRPSFVVLLLVVLSSGCGSDSDPSSVATTPPSATSTESADVSGPVIDYRFAVGAGYELEMAAASAGSPVMIFEAGTDGSGLEEYAALMRPLAERTMSLYIRPPRVRAKRSAVIRAPSHVQQHRNQPP